MVPAHADVHLRDYRNGSKQLDAAARLSANFNRFNLATGVRYRRQFLASGVHTPGQTTVELIGSGHIGDVRLRGTSDFDLSPAGRGTTWYPKLEYGG